MTLLRAQARIELPDPDLVLAPVCEHMIEHGGTTSEHDGARLIEFPSARARFSRIPGGTLVDVEAKSLDDLYFIRLSVVSHILEFANAKVPPIVWYGDGAELVRPPNFQIVEVVEAWNVTPRMRRIRFAGENVSRFSPMNALHLNILLQHPELSEPQWPRVGPNGLMQWQNPEHRPFYRKYTVRALDVQKATLDIDFVLHADAGPGSAFAEKARPGDRVGVVGPGGGGMVEADWHLFAGDETALPAIARMLESLPRNARGEALVEVADEREIQPIANKADIEIKWLCRNGAEAGSTLREAVERAQFPDNRSSVHAWVGCEYDAFRAIRTHLRQVRGLKKHEHLAVSYWRRGEAQA